MQTKDFDYKLPSSLIAQQPAADRAQARLMVVSRSTGALLHRRVADFPTLFQRNDLMVLNDTRVIPARVFGQKPKTGGKVEVLFIEECAPDVWKTFLRSSRRPQSGETFLLAEGRIMAEVCSVGERGTALLKLRYEGDLLHILEKAGVPPLPPYIKRPKVLNSETARRERLLDQERYQTVYARVPGAIAAPTAGLHFSSDLLARLENGGVQFAKVTLHVGPGTFVPVCCDRVEEHKIDSERFMVEPQAARLINEALAAKRRIIAVGTTVVRTLETAATENGSIEAKSGRTDLFIYPPFRFRVVRALLTNFHLPRSSLLMLVSAFAGHELIRHAYEAAIKEQYRFYSYGDCMLIV